MNRAKLWQSLKKGATTGSLPPAALPGQLPLSLYQSISTLPLSKFIECTVDNNLYALIISGAPSDFTLLQIAWANISQEYSEALGSNEYKLFTSLYKEVSLLKIEYESIHILVDSLRSIQEYILLNNYQVTDEIISIQQSLCKHLNDTMRTSCRFNNMDDASYQEELNKCIRRSKSLKIKLDLKLLAFEAIQKKNNNTGEKMDRKYFDSILITISDFAKYEIGENITVSKYCERIKRYNQYCESLKSKR